METLVSIEKIAKALDVSPWTIRLWISRGKIRSAKLGSRRLVPRSEIERLIRDNLKTYTPDRGTP